MMLSAFRFGFRPTSSVVRRAFSVSVADLGSVTRQDVLGASDSKWIGSYVSAVAKYGSVVAESGDASGSHGENIDEYFRRNFRKLSLSQANDVIGEVAKLSGPAACLDRFWIWETLEEAVRGDVDSMSEEEFVNTVKAFAAHYKGTQDLTDRLENRMYRSLGNDILNKQ